MSSHDVYNTISGSQILIQCNDFFCNLAFGVFCIVASLYNIFHMNCKCNHVDVYITIECQNIMKVGNTI